MPKGGFPWNKTVYSIVGGNMPLVFRGSRIDGTGRLTFSGDPADPGDSGETQTSGHGVSATFYDRMLATPIEDGVLYLYPSANGCFALQVDAPTFEDVIVIEAS
jgi:hypothetical protein